MEFNVELDEQHLERLGATAPLTGIIELVWNGFDADAEDVHIEFADNGLDGIDEIRVIDNGHGMTQQQILDGFKRLGGSWKRNASESPAGRALHGRDGRGRFLATGLGSRIRWHTVAANPERPSENLAIDVEMKVTNLAHVEVSDPKPTDASTGTRVLIDGFLKPPTGLGGDTPIEKLTGTFGLYLQTNNAHLFYGGEEIDPSKLQANRDEYEIPTPSDDAALLVVVEWERRVERALYLCDERGTPLSEQLAGIQAPGFEFTAYVHWAGFAADNNLAVAELGTGDTKQVLESTREALRRHFRDRAKDKTREQIAKWKEENTYPFSGAPETKAEHAARDVFDVVALTASSALNASEQPSRRLSLRLLREALENDPGSLHKVLSEVLDLKQDRLDELSNLLDRTPLTALIATSKAVADRLDFLRGLEALVLDPEVSKHVKERSQLHRILAAETWVFGEEFALAADDESLTTVLKQHLSILGRQELAPAEVLDHDGKRRIVDLMLARSLEQNRNRREHLIIELKAPKVAISDTEASQIERYATAVANDSRFNTLDVQWDFIVVSGEVRGTPAIRRESDNAPFGQLMDAKGIRVWALTWGEVIQNAQHRLKFVQQHLDYQPDADQAFDYLRRTHEKYLPSTIGPQTDPEPSAMPQP